ncbi:MAG: M20/M25/M40 family metallo-hydrolase [Firmicutes bacterium]|nr:M20/M25/M40 family metallo-hydrolase [Bacillota bacterium]
MTENRVEREAFIELLRGLVRCKSPYFHEEEAMAFTLDWLKKNDLPGRLYEYYEAKETQFHGQNVVGVLDSGRPGPVIYLGGHLDTVNLCEGWTYPPYEGVVEGDYLYGVGALDMKAGDAAILLALKRFAEKHRLTASLGADAPDNGFTGKIIYQFVSDEEGPFGLGTFALIRDNVDGVRDGADFAIICEPSAGFTGAPHPCICPGAKGGYNFTIRLKGRSSHAATPHLGINALTDAGAVMVELEKLEPVVDPKLGPSALCVINLTTDGNACSVPDHAAVEVFYHSVRGETVPSIKARVEEAVARAKVRSETEVVFRGALAEGFDGGFMPYCTDEEDPHIRKLAESVRNVCGCEPNYSYFQSIGDFNHIGGLLAIPTVLLGADGDRFHGADERVNLKSACEISDIVYDFLERIYY